MIVVYPMIVSNAVSETALPGIAKMLEQYLLAYSKDDILGEIGIQRRVNFKIKGGKLFMSEAITPEDIGAKPGTKQKAKDKKIEDIENKISDLEDKLEQAKTQAEKDRIRQAQSKLDNEKAKYQSQQKLDAATEKEREAKEKIKKFEEEQEKAKKSKIKLGTPTDPKTITLEPTGIPFETDQGTEFLGIKVVPMRVASEAKLSYLILSDLRMGQFRTIFTSFGRGVLRFISKVLLSKYSSPTGDPRKDILMGRTGLKGDAFVVLDKHHDVDEGLVNNPRALKKLFSLHWGNMIITDDIQKTASFCMKKFKGICNIISYQMMYQTLGQAQTYADLEDVRKKAGSLFKYKKSFSKVVSEIKTDQKLVDYYFLKEELKNGKNK